MLLPSNINMYLLRRRLDFPNNRKKVDIMIQIMTVTRNKMAPTCWITVTGWSEVEPSAHSAEVRCNCLCHCQTPGGTGAEASHCVSTIHITSGDSSVH
jgi:hypothetical protein